MTEVTKVIRFQEDNTTVNTSYHLICTSEGEFVKDANLVNLYDEEGDDEGRLKAGYVFGLEVDDDEAAVEAAVENGCCQAASSEYAIVYSVSSLLRSEGIGNGVVFDSSKAEVVKIVKLNTKGGR